MKLLFIMLTVISSFGANANIVNGEITPAAIKSFNRTFGNAKEVTWSLSQNNFYKVAFQMNGQYVTAFYNAEGTMMAVTRNISPLQLPVMLLAKIKKEHNEQWISELFEMSDESGTHYYVTLEDADQKLTLKSDGVAAWNVYQKVKK